MSVAFRRDSDEEHLEPKFEIPIPAGPNMVTPRGMALIDARVAELEAGIAGSLDELAVAMLKRDLRYWQTRQITAEVAPTPTGEKVEFGATVSVLLNGRQRTFQIVGEDEASPAAGLLSFTAPLSRAMSGAEVGEVLPFGGASDALRILAVSSGTWSDNQGVIGSGLAAAVGPPADCPQ
jgi:transcription elongation GreA/GreB family factor